MDNENPEMIEQQMSGTRQSLTEKIAALERRLVGTVDSATAAVRDTVESVKQAVEGTEDVVQSVKKNVSSIMDVREHIRSSPWISFSAAATAGFLTGYFLTARRTFNRPLQNSTQTAGSIQTDAARPGILGHLFGVAEGELKKFGETAVLAASQSLQSVLKDEIPDLVEKVVRTYSPESANGKAQTIPMPPRRA